MLIIIHSFIHSFGSRPAIIAEVGPMAGNSTVAGKVTILYSSTARPQIASFDGQMSPADPGG